MHSKDNLLSIATTLARQRMAPVGTLIKELLHYEILFALNESGAANELVFQGGTALRLCYRGNRYSEDLDFVSGKVIPQLPMADFTSLLQEQIADRYGLDVKVTRPKSGRGEGPVVVDRWKATIEVPNPDRTVSQSQFINIEIASVPAYEVEFMPLAANYPQLPSHLHQQLIAVESLDEIMADKIVALGARGYVKYRDIWDIKFLTDKGVKINRSLVTQKIRDYGLNPHDFSKQLESRIDALENPDCGAKLK